MSLFKTEEVELYLSNILEVGKEEKTLYNYIETDSDIERKFAQDCEADSKVKFFFKLPRGFKIPTPINNYNPDWAVILEDDQKVYFVAETKSDFDPTLKRAVENMKIACGMAHFALFEPEGVKYQVATKLQDLY